MYDNESKIEYILDLVQELEVEDLKQLIDNINVIIENKEDEEYLPF